MIVILRPQIERDQVQDLVNGLTAQGFEVSVVQTADRCLIDAVGVAEHEATGIGKKLKADSRVEQVILSGKPFHLVAGERTRPVPVGELEIGGHGLAIMAGPCTIESEAQIHEAAAEVARMGATILRGGAFKPSTSPYGFQGHGSRALGWMRDAARANRLAMVTEVMDPRRVEEVAEAADILQIGARNMQNFDLLREVGRSTKPVLLKRGMSARLEEWLLAAEHIANAGNQRIILCERGIRSFDTFSRNTLDVGAIAAAKKLTHLPVIADPSHAAGRRDLILPLSLAALAAGADGLIVEVHPTPEQAEKDGAQSLAFEEFASLMAAVQSLAPALGKSILRTSQSPVR